MLSLFVSLAGSREPTYYEAALSNQYSYINFGNSIWWKLLEIRQADSFYDDLGRLITVTPVEGLTPENLKDTIKKYIDEDRIIMIDTDVYHFVKDSIHYHHSHQIHSWVINGYDDDTDSFYCLSDNIGGFGENEVPAENFEQSIVPQTFENACEITISEDIEPFELRLEDIRANAREICKSIAGLSYCNFWKCDRPEYTEDRCFDLSKFIGRQHANQLLFDLMQQRGMIAAPLKEELCVLCRQLEMGWVKLRGRMVKYFLGGKVPEYDRMSVNAWTLLREEHAMWKAFLKGTE